MVSDKIYLLSIRRPVQGIAGCLLRFATINLESNRIPVVLSVHDELVTEVLDTPDVNVATVENLMCIIPPWAPGLPVAAEGWEGMRFRK